MTVTRLILCILLLLALPAFAAETESTPATEGLPSSEILAADLPAAEAAGCDTPGSTVEQSDVELTQILPDLEEELIGLTADPTQTSQATGFSCGGPFPVSQPGACNQTCAHCFRNSDCPPIFGQPQKCCTYCP